MALVCILDVSGDTLLRLLVTVRAVFCGLQFRGIEPDFAAKPAVRETV